MSFRCDVGHIIDTPGVGCEFCACLAREARLWDLARKWADFIHESSDPRSWLDCREHNACEVLAEADSVDAWLAAQKAAVWREASVLLDRELSAGRGGRIAVQVFDAKAAALEEKKDG